MEGLLQSKIFASQLSYTALFHLRLSPYSQSLPSLPTSDAWPCTPYARSSPATWCPPAQWYPLPSRLPAASPTLPKAICPWRALFFQSDALPMCVHGAAVSSPTSSRCHGWSMDQVGAMEVISEIGGARVFSMGLPWADWQCVREMSRPSDERSK